MLILPLINADNNSQTPRIKILRNLFFERFLVISNLNQLNMFLKGFVLLNFLGVSI